MFIPEGALPRVLIIDNDLGREDLAVAAYGATEAGWLPMPFDEVLPARQEIKDDPKLIHAAIIACRVGYGYPSEYTSPGLVELAEEHGIVYALLTTGPNSNNPELVADMPTNDTVTGHGDLKIAKAVENWLRYVRHTT